MLRDEPTIRPNLYRLPKDPVASHILVPSFRQAHYVHGAFGWFSAGWISRLAHGLAVFLSREDVPPLQFTIAPALFPSEYDALREAVFDRDSLSIRFVETVTSYDNTAGTGTPVNQVGLEYGVLSRVVDGPLITRRPFRVPDS